jgi:TrmH family RNA methyltransferase
MEKIESIKNTRIKEWKKLLRAKGRKKANQYIVEGFHLVEEAMHSGVLVEQVIIREDVLEEERTFSLPDNTLVVTEEVAKELSDTETSQGIFAVLRKEVCTLTGKIEAPYLFLDAVQDPGNVGTLIRSADAAGFEGVVLGRGSVDAYNPKTLRSAQGSHFHIKIIEQDIRESMQFFQEEGLKVYGTALDERAESYVGKHHNEPFALIVGNEGAGVDSDLLTETDSNLYIPIKGQAESLNVAIAASILMFSLYA